MQATLDKHDSHLNRSGWHVAELKAVNGVYWQSSVTLMKRDIAVIGTFSTIHTSSLVVGSKHGGGDDFLPPGICQTWLPATAKLADGSMPCSPQSVR